MFEYCATPVILLDAAPRSANSGAGDIERLQDNWLAIWAICNGRDANYLVGLRLLLEEGRFAIHSETGAILFQGTFEVDGAANPARIDLRHERDVLAGTTWKGIYELHGNRLRMCFNAADPLTARPAELQAGRASGHVRIDFRRLC